LLKKALPVSREAKRSSKTGDTAKPAFVAALTDGEDFELLFTVAAKSAVPLLDAWKEKFPKLKLSCIGKITAGSALTIRDEQGVRPFQANGYVHFA
jgi:thiamine-monophosphate kinase